MGPQGGGLLRAIKSLSLFESGPRPLGMKSHVSMGATLWLVDARNEGCDSDLWATTYSFLSVFDYIEEGTVVGSMIVG